MILSVTRTAAPAANISTVKTGGSLKGQSFHEVMQGVRGGQATPVAVPTDPFQAMQQLGVRLQSGVDIGSRELLLYQVRAGQYGMQVELVSKVAESVSASVRKLQNQG